MVIGELPVGSVVRFGRYSLPHTSDDMFDIDWIKVSRENEFISEKVLLGIQYDPMEGWNTNRNYELSNIRQFMNSELHSWYHPTHPNDCGPGYIMLDSFVRTPIHRYSGLLSMFTDEELITMEGPCSDRLRLPTYDEINGAFPYFKRHGKRAHAITQFGCIAFENFRETMFARYYVMGRHDDEVLELDRSGTFKSISPAKCSGVRPVCKLKRDVEVEKTGENTYKMLVSSDKPIRYFKETQPIDWLLGL